MATTKTVTLGEFVRPSSGAKLIVTTLMSCVVCDEDGGTAQAACEDWERRQQAIGEALYYGNGEA